MRLTAMASARARRAGVALAAVALAGVAAIVDLPVAAEPQVATQPAAASVSAASTLPASRFVAITPTRVLDSRVGQSPRRGQSRLWDNMAMSIDPINGTAVATQLVNAGIAPAEATAVVANVTAVNAGGGGFSSLWPTGFTRPLVATNNPQFFGDTTGNLSIIPLGLDGKISIYTSEEADYVVDVVGVMVETAGPVSAGRFMSLGPTRHSDTRSPGLHVGAGQTRHPGGQVRTIDLTPAAVPATASAVVLNVTALNSTIDGFLTVSPGGVGAGPGLEYASLSIRAFEARGNQVIVGATNGLIDLYTHVAADVVLDVAGYFTGNSDPAGQEGLFVPITPGRLLDTREPFGPTGLTNGAPIAADQPFTLPVAGALDGSIPASGATAAVLNVVAVTPASGGFIASYPAGAPVPAVASVNYNRAGDVVPNQAITTLGGGSVDLVSSQLTHMVVDVTGWFLSSTGTPPATTRPTKTIPADHPAGSISRLPGGLANRPPSAPFDFLFDRTSGERPDPTLRVAWNACAPIRYALNIDRANDAQIAVLIDAVKHLESSLGIDFQFAGVTSAGLNIEREVLVPGSQPFQYLPPDDDGTGAVDIVIAFSDPNDTPDLAGSTIGIGGSSRGPANPFTGRARSSQGFAIMDLEGLEAGGGVVEMQRIMATTVHELGHMVGLAHVSNGSDGVPFPTQQGLERPGEFSQQTVREQLMFPSLNTAITGTTFSPGDLLGLWELYNAEEQSCNNLFVIADPAPEPPVDVAMSDH